MARVSVEDCLDKVTNRYMLIHLAAKRARQLAQGHPCLIDCKNKIAVKALREVAAGKVYPTEVDDLEK